MTSDMDIKEAAKYINEGGVICIPTETVYGLACDASDERAINHIYELKGRDEGKPMQIMVDSLEKAQEIGIFSEKATKVGQKHWPGPLTIVVKRRDNAPISPILSAGLDTVGIRVPDSEIMMNLLKETGKILATTSANISGEPAATSYDEVIHQFGDKLSCVIDGGKSEIGIPSMVVDFVGENIKILREGSIKKEDL